MRSGRIILMLAVLLVVTPFVAIGVVLLGGDVTNTYSGDSDGDNLPDEVEASDKRLASADPDHRDVYVEITYAEGMEPQERQLERIKQEFASAPIENPNGEEGIQVHFVVDDQPTDIPSSLSTSDLHDEDGFAARSFNHRGGGYYHVMITEDAQSDGRDVGGFYAVDTPHMVVVDGKQETETGIMAHELGHALGIEPDDADGVDSGLYSYDQYPSVMNYNAPRGSVEFSDGSNGTRDFNDWEEIEEEMNDHASKQNL